MLTRWWPASLYGVLDAKARVAMCFLGHGQATSLMFLLLVAQVSFAALNPACARAHSVLSLLTACCRGWSRPLCCPLVGTILPPQ